MTLLLSQLSAMQLHTHKRLTTIVELMRLDCGQWVHLPLVSDNNHQNEAIHHHTLVITHFTHHRAGPKQEASHQQGYTPTLNRNPSTYPTTLFYLISTLSNNQHHLPK